MKNNLRDYSCTIRDGKAKEYLAFAPLKAPDDFAAAFTAAEGSEQFRQKQDGRHQLQFVLAILRIKTLALAWQQIDLHFVRIMLANRQVQLTLTFNDARLIIALKDATVMNSDDELHVTATQVA